MVRQGKKATNKSPRVESGLSGCTTLQGPVSEPNSVGCYRQLNSGSLHKKTRRNPLSGDVCSTVKNHDLVPSLPNNSKSQAHSRMSECDGRSLVQVKPSPINRMVATSAGVQTDLSKVVHSSHTSICQSPEPQSSNICISRPRPKCLRHICSQHNLVGSHCLCILCHGSPTHGNPKDQAMQLPDHYNSPRLARDALVLGSTEIKLQLPVSTTLLKHFYVFHSNPQHLNLHAWCLGVDNSRNKASLQRWQREWLPLKGHQQGPSTSQGGPCLRSGAEKILWISPPTL